MYTEYVRLPTKSNRRGPSLLLMDLETREGDGKSHEFGVRIQIEEESMGSFELEKRIPVTSFSRLLRTERKQKKKALGFIF